MAGAAEHQLKKSIDFLERRLLRVDPTDADDRIAKHMRILEERLFDEYARYEAASLTLQLMTALTNGAGATYAANPARWQETMAEFSRVEREQHDPLAQLLILRWYDERLAEHPTPEIEQGLMDELLYAAEAYPKNGAISNSVLEILERPQYHFVKRRVEKMYKEEETSNVTVVTDPEYRKRIEAVREGIYWGEFSTIEFQSNLEYLEDQESEDAVFHMGRLLAEFHNRVRGAKFSEGRDGDWKEIKQEMQERIRGSIKEPLGHFTYLSMLEIYPGEIDAKTVAEAVTAAVKNCPRNPDVREKAWGLCKRTSKEMSKLRFLGASLEAIAHPARYGKVAEVVQLSDYRSARPRVEPHTRGA